MDVVELADVATQMTEAYRSVLLLDPFYKINVEVTEGDYHCQCTKDENSSLAWIVKLNPRRHKDAYDVQYSVLEGLLYIMFEPLKEDREVIKAIVARLTTSYCNLLSEDEEDEEDEYEGEYEG